MIRGDVSKRHLFSATCNFAKLTRNQPGMGKIGRARSNMHGDVAKPTENPNGYCHHLHNYPMKDKQAACETCINLSGADRDLSNDAIRPGLGRGGEHFKYFINNHPSKTPVGELPRSARASRTWRAFLASSRAATLPVDRIVHPHPDVERKRAFSARKTIN